MKTHFLVLLTVVLFAAACTENIDMSNRYTFREETIASYLEKHSQFSEYVKLLDTVKVSKISKSTVRQLLSARGNYTVFAPNNQAIQNYLDTLYVRGLLSEPSWDGFPDSRKLDSIQKVIVFNSIIDGGDRADYVFQTSAFPEPGDEFMLSNMNERKLTVGQGNNPDSIFINGKYLVSLTNHDILAINGYIHEVYDVIAPSNETLADIVNDCAENPESGMMVISKLVRLCGMDKELSKVKDEVYEEMYLTGDIPVTFPAKHKTQGQFGYMPQHRKYGYTFFAETDEVWREALGKEPVDITVEDVRKYIQDYNLCPGATDDANYTDENNAINQFVTYHLLPMRIPKNKLTIHYTEKGYNEPAGGGSPTVPTWEIYTTMGKRRLLKIYEPGQSGPEGYFLNRFAKLNNGRKSNYFENSCQPEDEGIHIVMPEDQDQAKYQLVNAIIYPIDKILAYDNHTRDNFQKERLRFDISSIFPEFMNNDIRYNKLTTVEALNVGIPITDKYNYLEDCYIGKNSEFYYLSGYKQNWSNYQGDELNVVGRYDMTFRLPPVPRRGTYEIRYLVGSGSTWRSMCQVYFGSDPDNLPAMGIPLDLRQGAEGRYLLSGLVANDFVGYVSDDDLSNDDDLIAENDKKMRANGYMKAPNYYWPENHGIGTLARANKRSLRKIIVTETMDPEVTYYLRFKNVLDNEDLQFYMDFIEYCPKEIYDNPMEPEDVW